MKERLATRISFRSNDNGMGPDGGFKKGTTCKVGKNRKAPSQLELGTFLGTSESTANKRIVTDTPRVSSSGCFLPARVAQLASAAAFQLLAGVQRYKVDTVVATLELSFLQGIYVLTSP